MRNEETTEFEMTDETLSELFIYTEDLMAIYAEDKILKEKIPTHKQLILEMELSIISFLESCNNILNYSVQKTEAYYNTMVKFMEEMSIEVLSYIEIEQR
jgi:hypothetical protein